MGLGAVLDERDVVGRAEASPGRDVARLPVQVHQQDGAGPGRQASLDALHRQQSGPGLDVSEDGSRSGANDGEDCREGRHRRRDDLVARPDPQAPQGDLDPVEPVRDADRIGRPAGLGPGLLEPRDVAAEHPVVRVEDRGERRDLGLPQRRGFRGEARHRDHDALQ